VRNATTFPLVVLLAHWKSPPTIGTERVEQPRRLNFSDDDYDA
jgi:hypothetical protein